MLKTRILCREGEMVCGQEHHGKVRLIALCSKTVCIVSHSGTEDTRLSNACNSDPVCPPKCRCEANVVDCSNLKLTKIPEHIPSSTNEL